MTLIEHHPTMRIHGRTRQRSAVTPLAPPPPRPAPPAAQTPLLRTRYCAALTSADVEAHSTVLQALTFGLWLGRVIEWGAALLSALSVTWLLRRIVRQA